MRRRLPAAACSLLALAACAPTPDVTPDAVPADAATAASATVNASTSAHAEDAPLLAPAAEHPVAAAVQQRALPANASAILQQARTGLTTALREVRSCRAQRAQCLENLTVCTTRSTAALKEVRRSAQATAQQVQVQAQEQVQQAQQALEKRNREYTDLRTRAESLSTAAQRQLTALKKEQAELRQREEACRTRLDATAAAEEQHRQLQATLEGKHSKLTEVYKSLESECQVELRKCRSATADAAGAPAPEGGAEPQAAEQQQQRHAAGGEAGGPCAPASDGGALGGGPHQLRLLLATFAAGVLVGWAVRGSRTDGKRSRGGAHNIEEMRGWMPVSNAAADMKLS